MANVIVLFEVTPTKEGMKKYLDLAAMLKPMLAGFEGFIRAERFTSLNEEGKLLSMNVWTDESAVERWRNVMEHRMSQKEGREKLFESYKITVCSEIRSYSDTDRMQAPADSNQFLKYKKRGSIIKVAFVTKRYWCMDRRDDIIILYAKTGYIQL